MEKSFQDSVLIIEDNPAMNSAICEILELHGYRVFSASDGEAALLVLKDHRPDVVLCDIMMPNMDGYTLLRHTRADDRLRTLPFIFLTARSSPEDKRLAKRIGVEDYLVKPVDPEDLILAVENSLRRSRDLARETQYQMDLLRSQIVRTLQHEFRTPLTFVLGYAEYLSELTTSQIDVETLRVSTNAILEGGHRLQDLVEKFLLLADIQFRQALPSKADRVKAYTILKNAANTRARDAEAASIEIRLPAQESCEEVLGDIKYLHRAVVHLLENAIQYRKPTSRNIWLSISITKNYIGLAVKDESCGIPPETLERLCEPFVQVARDERTVPGAGLSLTLIQHIVRLHGGYMDIESEVGKGSTFTIWLPKPLDSEHGQQNHA